YLSGVTYDYDTDSLTGTTDFSALMTAVDSNIPSDTTTATQYLASMGQFMDQLASDLSVSASDFDSTLQSDFESEGLPLSLTAVDDLHYLAPAFDTSGDAIFTYDSAGAVANGISGYNNVLQANGDISQNAAITGMQTLDTTNVTLTAGQFGQFDSIIG